MKALQCSADSAQVGNNLDVLEQRFRNDDGMTREWYFLGMIGKLLNKRATASPVSIATARGWVNEIDPDPKIVVLLDEAIPVQHATTRILGSVPRLLFIKRLLAAADIHLVMIGTNTLMLNFGTAAQAAEESRSCPNVQLVCVSSRALPPFLDTKEQFHKLSLLLPKSLLRPILNEANPWLASELACNVHPNGKRQACHLNQAAVTTRQLVNLQKKLSKYSLYAAFQSATHSDCSQAQLFHSFACLNLWGSQSSTPEKGDRAGVLLLSRDENDHKLIKTPNGQDIRRVKAFFVPAWKDPIAFAICANGGRPFSEESALAVLQQICGEAHLHDPTALDAFKRDGNMLESFIAVVLVIASWASPDHFLQVLAWHLGNTDERDVNAILQQGGLSAARCETTSQQIARAFRNLVPILEGEEPNVRFPQTMGYLRRCKDSERMDGAGRGGTGSVLECKNRLPIGPVDLTTILALLTSRKITRTGQQKNATVAVLAVSSLAPTSNVTDSLITGNCSGDWVILHLKEGQKWNCFRVPNGPQKKLLVLLEVGQDTMPFKGTRPEASPVDSVEHLSEKLSTTTLEDQREDGTWEPFGAEQQPRSGWWRGLVRKAFQDNVAGSEGGW